METSPPPADQSLKPEQITAIVQRREAALLQKYIDGKSSPAEQAEIAHVIAQLPRRSTAAAVMPAPPGGFTLESPAASAGAGQRRTGLAHELSVYVAAYGAAERTIKRWLATGRQAVPPDPCPLDEPLAMPTWWARHMKQRPPDKIHAIAKGHGVPEGIGPGRNGVKNGEKIENFAPASSFEPPAPATGTPPGRFDDVGELDIEGSIAGLRHTLAVHKRRLDEALEAADEGRISLCQRNYATTLDLLRKSEQSLTAVLAARDVLVPKADVTADLAQLLTALVSMRGAMAQRIVERMPDLSESQRRRLFQEVEAVRVREDDILRSAATWKDGPPPLDNLPADDVENLALT